MNQTTSSFTDGLLEWWHIVIFAGTTLIGYVLGHAKRGWTLDQVQSRVTALEARLTSLENTTDLDSRTLGLLGNDLSHIRSTLADIKRSVEALQ